MKNRKNLWVFFVVTIKYSVLCAGGLIFFSWLKEYLHVTYVDMDVYASIVAIVFIGIGISISYDIWKEQQKLQVQPPVGGRHEKRAKPIEAILSKREMDVVLLLAKTSTNKKIADELCIEVSTLKTHINRIYRKLEVRNRAQLIEKYPQVLTLIQIQNSNKL